MSCSTAARWFVDDKEYYTKEADYALIGSSEKLIRREIDEGNNRPFATYPDGSLVPLSFGIYFRKDYTPPYLCYDFAVPGRMLWADVDDSNPAHKEEMKNAFGELKLSKEELDDRYGDIWEQLLPLLIYKPRRFGSVEDLTDANREQVEADKARHARQDFYARLENGELDPLMLGFLLEDCKEPEKRQRFIEMITDQTQSRDKRPLMVLVGMIEDMRNPNPGEKTGYVIGYDVIKDHFICKPFFSNKDHHPLASSWFEDFQAKYPDDQVLFTLSPKDLIEDIFRKRDALTHKLDSGTLKEVQPTEAERESGLAPYLDTSDDETYPYVLLTRIIAAKFVENHWVTLIGWDPALADDADVEDILRDRQTFDKARKDVKHALYRMRIPLVAKTETSEKKPCLCKYFPIFLLPFAGP